VSLDCVIYCAFYSILFRGAVFSQTWCRNHCKKKWHHLPLLSVRLFGTGDLNMTYTRAGCTASKSPSLRGGSVHRQTFSVVSISSTFHVESGSDRTNEKQGPCNRTIPLVTCMICEHPLQWNSGPTVEQIAITDSDKWQRCWITWIVSLFLAADLARTAVKLFITLARQSGTRCQMNLEIQTVLMAFNDSWKQFFSAVTSVTSVLVNY